MRLKGRWNKAPHAHRVWLKARRKLGKKLEKAWLGGLLANSCSLCSPGSLILTRDESGCVTGRA
jgi:hypothetical protein